MRYSSLLVSASIYACTLAEQGFLDDILAPAGEIISSVINDVAPIVSGLSHNQWDDGQADSEEVSSIINAPDDPDGIDPPQAVDNFYNNYYENTIATIQSGSCNTQNVAVRKEWGTLSAHEQEGFISAFQCLHSLPAKTDPNLAPGARSRVDDFVVPHVTMLLQVHRSPLQLPWHRQFVFEVERALQNECGYTGTMPFWDWSKYLDKPWEQNPLFDGSSTSLSGNGVARGNCVCVESGPLANWTVNLDGSACSANPQPDLLGYNPRCLERNMDPNQMTNMTYANVAATLRTADIQSFSLRIDAPYVGIHALPHTFVGGAQNSIPGSASDPWFFLHHAMLDRTWAIWQAQDFATRRDAIVTQGSTFAPLRGGGWGDAPDMSLDSVLSLGVAGNFTVRETVSPTLGEYCYMYGR